MKSLHKVFLILFLFFACSKEKKTIINNSYAPPIITDLEKLDSIKIEYLGNPTVHDIDSNTGVVIFMEHKEFSEEIFIADFEGNIHSYFSKLGDIPDGYGRLMATLRVKDKNSFIAYGYRGFLTYNFEGKIINKVNPKDFQVPNYVPMLMGHGMEKMENNFLYINQDSPEDYGYSNKNIYNDMYLLDLLDPTTGYKERIIKFPESSIFKSGKYFFRNAWDPVFHIENKKMTLSRKVCK